MTISSRLGLVAILLGACGGGPDITGKWAGTCKHETARGSAAPDLTDVACKVTVTASGDRYDVLLEAPGYRCQGTDAARKGKTSTQIMFPVMRCTQMMGSDPSVFGGRTMAQVSVSTSTKQAGLHLIGTFGGNTSGSSDTYRSGRLEGDLGK